MRTPAIVTTKRLCTRGASLLLALGAVAGCGGPSDVDGITTKRSALAPGDALAYASVLEAPVSAVSWAPQRIDLFTRALDDSLQIKSFVTDSWVPGTLTFNPLGGTLVGSPSVVSWGTDRLDIFGRGTDGQLYTKAWTGTTWVPSTLGWISLSRPAAGVDLAVKPAAVSWGSNRIDILAGGSDHMLYIKSWTGTEWFPAPAADWNQLGGPFLGAPEVVSWGSGRLDILVRNNDGSLSLKSWTGTAWAPSTSGFADMGAPAGASIVAQPSIESWAANRLDMFVAATDGQVYIKSWTGSQWVPSQTGWNPLGAPPGGIVGAPKAISWGPDRLDIFARGRNDGQLYIKSWTGSAGGWVPAQTADWNPLGAPPGGAVAQPPEVVSWAADRLDIFVTGIDGQLYTKSWAGSTVGWVPSQTGWNPLGGPISTSDVDMLPFWTTTTMYDESVMMVPAAGGVLSAKLLSPATEILSVRSLSRGAEYVRDIDWKNNGDTLTLTATSRAPSMLSMPKTDNRGWDGEIKAYHQNQLAVTYRHAVSNWGVPVPALTTRLPRTLSALNAHNPLKVVYYGDSITAGYSASGFPGTSGSLAPYMEPWPNQLTKRLRARYGSDVTASNSALPGTTSEWGLQNIHTRVTDLHPDLVVIAFGMNDGLLPPNGTNIPAATFQDYVRGMINAVRAGTDGHQGNPNAEFILVSTMLPNPQTYAGSQAAYAQRLKELAGTGVEVVDVTAAHSALLTKKAYVDMTGNGINHPNDFLGRWYAQLLAAVLGAI